MRFEWGVLKVKKFYGVYQFANEGQKNFWEYKPYFEMMWHKRQEPARVITFLKLNINFKNKAMYQAINGISNPFGEHYSCHSWNYEFQ